ncbi:hypothetical protein [Nocardia violaceofusca]|uniref:hypothetical protein n=1 Tax=Nocardia violaceofusca TaxID=941182 RepID=UPI0012F48227|nr:hypothetical protein [Nocardia violaceofusca]
MACVDVGAACAAVQLSRDGGHLRKTYHLHNGHDVLMFDEVAALLGEVLGVPHGFETQPLRSELPAH